MSASPFLETIRDYLVSGALSKGWGGPACRAHVDMTTHLFESAFWVVVAIVFFFTFDLYGKMSKILRQIDAEYRTTKPAPFTRGLEEILAFVHFAMSAQLLYYKFNIMSLINLLQPCHVILFLQGIALYSTGRTGAIITMCMLPAMTGTLLAMLWPDVAGLDQPFEMESYWLQHYLIQSVPLLLLCRRNFILAKYAGAFTVVTGIWFLLLMHFSLYEVRLAIFITPTDMFIFNYFSTFATLLS